MHGWQAECQSGRGLLLDGALGTLLEDRGVDVSTPLWASAALLTEEGCDEVERAHRSYVEAGAEMVIANTHNASLGYCQRWLDEVSVSRRPKAPGSASALMALLNERAMRSARRAGARFVASSIASPDRPYTPKATLSPEEVAAAVQPQVEALAGERSDLLVAEMCTTRSDVEGVAAAFEDLAVPVGFGLVCKGGALLDGTPLETAVALARRAHPAVFFVQCTPYPSVAEALRRLIPVAEVPVGAYGNDGRGWVNGGWSGERVGPESYTQAAAEWRKLGAALIGGCCGTGPEHIRALSRRFGGERPSNVQGSPSDGGEEVA